MALRFRLHHCQQYSSSPTNAYIDLGNIWFANDVLLKLWSTCINLIKCRLISFQASVLVIPEGCIMETERSVIGVFDKCYTSSLHFLNGVHKALQSERSLTPANINPEVCVITSTIRGLGQGKIHKRPKFRIKLTNLSRSQKIVLTPASLVEEIWESQSISDFWHSSSSRDTECECHLTILLISVRTEQVLHIMF